MEENELRSHRQDREVVWVCGPLITPGIERYGLKLKDLAWGSCESFPIG